MLQRLLLIPTLVLMLVMSYMPDTNAEDGNTDSSATAGDPLRDLLEIEPDPASAVTGQDRSEPAAKVEDKKINQTGIKPKPLPAENKSDEKIMISGQRDNHLIITTGDLIYLKTTGYSGLNKKKHYIIYKEVSKKIPEIGKKPTVLYEPVGKLKVLEIKKPLSLAKVIAARGVIQKGDFIFLGNRP